MKRKLAALAEGFCASVDPADVWCFARVCKFVFFEVLVECEFFSAVAAFEVFFLGVHEQVALQGEFCVEYFVAALVVADKLRLV